VVTADFVPLTVAGQRWLYTIFPARSMKLRGNLTFFVEQIVVVR
jgi:hypothetical protein